MYTCNIYVLSIEYHYNPDNGINVGALRRLEAAGFNLAAIRRQLKRKRSAGSTDDADNLLDGESDIIPTWKSLFYSLSELGYEDMSREIEHYLSGKQL